MSGRVIWDLSDEDFKTIENLFEKRLALENLTKIIEPSNTELYEKVVVDYGKTMRQLQVWWTTMSTQHQWPGTNWRVNFETQQVMAVEAGN